MILSQFELIISVTRHASQSKVKQQMIKSFGAFPDCVSHFNKPISHKK